MFCYQEGHYLIVEVFLSLLIIQEPQPDGISSNVSAPQTVQSNIDNTSHCHRESLLKIHPQKADRCLTLVLWFYHSFSSQLFLYECNHFSQNNILFTKVDQSLAMKKEAYYHHTILFTLLSSTSRFLGPLLYLWILFYFQGIIVILFHSDFPQQISHIEEGRGLVPSFTFLCIPPL